MFEDCRNYGNCPITKFLKYKSFGCNNLVLQFIPNSKVLEENGRKRHQNFRLIKAIFRFLVSSLPTRHSLCKYLLGTGYEK